MSKLPSFLHKYFWGDDLNKLNLKDHKNYIAKTILSIGNMEAVKWLNDKFDRPFLKGLLESKRIDEKSKNLWKLYYS